jgi:phosphoenolpyruvate synthase/pyruvate phosphate dikinase
MNWIVSAENINQADRSRVGGKGYALALLAKGGFAVSKTLCVTSETYQEIAKHSRTCAGKKYGIVPPAFEICFFENQFRKKYPPN